MIEGEISMDIYDNLKKAGLELPEPPARGGLYSPCVEFDKNLIYVSGCGCVIGDEKVSGKVGKEYTLEQGQEYAKKSMLNVLAALKAAVGDLNKVKKPVKLIVFVASEDDFYQQPQVANGGSQVLADLFGMDKVPARSAVGVNALPGNIPVETEAIFELKD
jgi:enamine deaminase RidA (YjgF/YER057c/UK114 family)